MALDEASAQLHADIRESVQSALATRRPILHHLNPDTSWFLQIPRPESAIRNGGRIYFNILIDPWFSGGQSDVASWFSQQFHATPSSIADIASLEELARETEVLARGLRRGADSKTSSEDDGVESLIDAVAVSHEFTDHCHKDTLLEIHPNVPVFAIKEAANLIKGWKHFRNVVVVNSFGVNGDTDWRTTSLSPLPDWIGISRLLQTDDVLNYHSALLIVFDNKDTTLPKSTKTNRQSAKKHTQHQPSDSAEAVVYTPHGIHSTDLALIPNASPPIETLVFLHGLDNVRVGTVSGRTALQSNLGAHNGLKAQRILKAKYWIGTHDEIKQGGGLVSWFLQRDVISLQDALERERNEIQDGVKGNVDDIVQSANWVELGNGESRLLL